MLLFIVAKQSIKSIPLPSLSDNSSTVYDNFVIFCRSIECLYQHISAKLFFATANNEKDTVNFKHVVLTSNFHFFQQNLMPTLHDNDVTVT